MLSLLCCWCESVQEKKVSIRLRSPLQSGLVDIRVVGLCGSYLKKWRRKSVKERESLAYKEENSLLG